MLRETKITIGVLGLLLTVAAACTGYFLLTNQSETSSTQATFGYRDDVLPFTDMRGSEVDILSNSSDKRFLVVTSWASWCPGCADELSDFDALAGTLSDDVRIVAINRREGSYQAQRFLQTLDELSNLEIILDESDRFYRDVAGYTMPETIIYDSRGEILFRHRGTGAPRVVEEYLLEHIQQ